MVTGRRPFCGKDDLAVISNILDSAPDPIHPAANVPAALLAVIERALDKDVARRYRSADAVLRDLVACRTAQAGPAASRSPLYRTLRTAAVIAAAVLAVTTAGWSARAYQRNAREQWARNTALPEATRLVGQNQRGAAFVLAKQIEQVLPDDPAVTALWPQVAANASMVTTPPGASVYMQEYAAGETASWEFVGTTPFKDVRLPRGVLRFRVEKDGYEPRQLASTNPGSMLRNVGGVFGLTLVDVDLLAEGVFPKMVAVGAGTFPVSLSGFNTNDLVKLDEFLIDRFEVTNEEFKRFIQADGYEKQDYWIGKPAQAMVDSTGRPGPSTWELGEFPAGQARFPVSGVSWFEAVAYCRLQGKILPTIYHWARAALSPTEISNPLAPAMIPLSNIGQAGVVAVGTTRGIGPYGTYDMAGNVREWAWNESSGGRRWIPGGAWNDPQWLMVVPNSLPPGDRASTNGFRCMRSEAPIRDGLMSTVDHFAGARTAKPVSDEVYRVFARQLAYQPGPANPRVEATDDSHPDWIRQTISFDAGYDGERARAYLFLPRSAAPPFQLVVHFPPLNDFLGKASSEGIRPARFDFVPRSGRAYLYPVYKGAFERWDNFVTLQGDEYDRTFRARLFQWRQEVGRLLDVMSDRADIDGERIAYMGMSFGSSTPIALLALEDRFKVAVLQAPGFPFRRLPPEVDPVNFVNHITMPVLMLGGRLDFVLPVETAQKPMFAALATPPDRKRHVIFESGHVDYPRSEMIRESLAWFDRYLGPVNAAKK